MTYEEVRILCKEELHELAKKLHEKIDQPKIFDISLLIIATDLIGNAAMRQAECTDMDQLEILDKMLSDIRDTIETDFMKQENIRRVDR